MNKQPEKIRESEPLSSFVSPFSFGLTFKNVNSAGMVTARFRGSHEFQGYDGIFHGGVLSALVDNAMAHCLINRGIEAVTGELIVRYLEPVPCNAWLTICAWVKEELPPLYYMRSEIKVDGKVVVKARAKFMKRAEGM